MPKIIVYRGRTHLFDHWIEKTEVVIGRSAEADIPLDSPAASRKHCRIVRRQGSYILEELGAKNGLFVNGQFCNVHTLQNGDRIEIADHILSFSRTRKEAQHEARVDRAERGAAFRITQAEVDRAMTHKKKGDSAIVRQGVAQAGANTTTAVSPEELEKLMAEMNKKLQAHVDVVASNGEHVRSALDQATYVLGFTDACDIQLGERFWPWGKLAAKIQTLPDKSHKLIRLSKWVGIKVNSESLTGVHILRDKDVLQIGGVLIRYLGRSEIAR